MTAKTIVIASSKGGAGKTTLATMLLHHALRHGYRVAALDTDLTQALFDWLKKFKLPVTSRHELDEKRINPTIRELQTNHDLVIVDTAGVAAQATLFTFMRADLVLIPSGLSDRDVLETQKTMDLVQSTADAIGRPVTTRVVLTGYKPAALVSKHVVSELERLGLQETATRLHDLVGYIDMTHSGLVPVGSAVDLQAAALFNEALELMGVAPPALPVAAEA